MSGRREKLWSGDFIIVWTDRSWEFFRCCRCGHRLSDRASRERGLGPECVKHAPVDLVWTVKREERRRYKRELAAEHYLRERNAARRRHAEA